MFSEDINLCLWSSFIKQQNKIFQKKNQKLSFKQQQYKRKHVVQKLHFHRKCISLITHIAISHHRIVMFISLIRFNKQHIECMHGRDLLYLLLVHSFFGSVFKAPTQLDSVAHISLVEYRVPNVRVDRFWTMFYYRVMENIL